MSVLDNGIRVMTEAMPYMRSVTLGCWVGTGSRAETAEQNGISHFIEHMLFKGTRTRSAERIAREMDELGGDMDAYTTRDLASYSIRVLGEHLDRGVPILADMLAHPRLDEADIEKEKRVIGEEMKMERDDPETVVHDTYISRLWRGHALGRPIIGTRKTLATFDRAMVRRYHRQHYTGANLIVSAAGRLEHAAVVALIERYLGALPAGRARPAGTPPVPRRVCTLKQKASLEQVQLCIGTPMCEAAHEWRHAAYALNTLLGASMSSRLFQNIRERRGLAYTIYSELNLYQDAGCLAVYAGVAPERAREVAALIVDEMDRLGDEPVGADELHRTREQMKGALLLGLESTGSRMSNLARQWMTYGRFFTPDELSVAVDAVTSEQIRTVARTYFRREQFGLAAVGPTAALSRARGEWWC